MQQQRRRTSVPLTIIFLLLLAAFVQPLAVSGQWATSGNNINTTNTGNVGIGTATPGRKLEIIDTENTAVSSSTFWYGTFGGIRIRNESPTLNTIAGIQFLNGNSNPVSGIAGIQQSASTGALGFFTGGGGTVPERIRITSAGNVGIGTTGPQALLDLQKAFSDTGGSGFSLGFSNGGGIYHGWRMNSSNVLVLDSYYANVTNTWNPSIAVTKASFVGIGTANPTTKLDVAGDLNASGTITGGTINAKYQDVAEWVSSRQKLPPGTVVILDPERTNQVIASTQPYDTRVAGVVSDQPGVLLGEGGEGKVKVATTGRVKVRVDASRGAIKIGDLLVTSDKEGLAMKSEPIILQGRRIHAPGTIIGKALEAIEGGVGEIQVLLSLQ